jgi:hypothetical protein
MSHCMGLYVDEVVVVVDDDYDGDVGHHFLTLN